MKLCELLVLGHCIHLPLISSACASSGQSYNVGYLVAANFCDVIDTAMTGDPIAFWGFLTFSQKVLVWSVQASSMSIITLLRVSGKNFKRQLDLEVGLKKSQTSPFRLPDWLFMDVYLCLQLAYIHIWPQRTLRCKVFGSWVALPLALVRMADCMNVTEVDQVEAKSLSILRAG